MLTWIRGSSRFVSRGCGRKPLSFALGLVIAGLFVGCAQFEAINSDDGRSNPIEVAIAEAEFATARVFAAESTMSRAMDDGAVAYRFEGLDGDSILTVILREGIPEPTWRVTYLEGDFMMLLDSLGNRTEVRAPNLTVQDRCTYCAETQWNPPYWVENWVTKAIKDYLPYTAGAACSAAGGIWAGGLCYVIVNQLVDDGYWTTGYWECVDWRPIDPSGVCIDD